MKHKDSMIIMALRYALIDKCETSKTIVQEAIISCWGDIGKNAKLVIKSDIKKAIEQSEIVPAHWVPVLGGNEDGCPL